MQWTKEQIQAIEQSGTNILVSAGAGSGKTAVLTERVIRKLLKGESLKNLIILTFTNAAALNMKKKIKEAIIKTNNEKLNDELEYIDQANIMTFDAFTLSLVKQYSYLLNVTPDICVLSSSELNLIYSRIMDEVLEGLYDSEDFKSLLKQYTIRNVKNLKKCLINLFKSYLNNMINPNEYLNNYLSNYSEKDYNDKLLEYGAFLIEKKELALSGIKEIQELDKEELVYEKIYNDCKLLIEANTFEELSKISKINYTKTNNANDEIKKAKERFKKKINDFLTSIKNKEACHKEYFDMEKYIKIIIEILLSFIEKYKAFSISHNCFSFNDIAILAINLLKENNEIREEIINNTNEILVDEYQDTSDIQEELISLLSNNNCYMVGDVKQSIYRFRNANPDIFKAKFNEYGKNNGGQRIDLTKNFRSRKEVLSDINYLFDELMTDDFGGIQYNDGHRLEFGNDKYKDDINEGIEFHSMGDKPSNKTKDKNEESSEEKSDESRNEKEERITKEFEYILKDILWKIKNENAKYKDFTILTRNTFNYNTYSALCKKYDIPLLVQSRKQFVRNDEIIVLISILSYLIDKEDLISYNSILRSFLFEEKDETLLEKKDHIAKHICEKIRDKMPYLSFKGLIQMIYDEFSFFSKIRKLEDPERAEYRLLFMLKKVESLSKIEDNVEMIIAYLNQMRKESYLNKNEDIEFEEKEKAQEDAVSLMTIHKSKGLEFKYCYITETNTKLVDKKERGEDPVLKFHPKYGFILFNEEKEKSFIEDLFKRNERIEGLYEELRLLYVALTRAMEKAVIFTYQIDDGERIIKKVERSEKLKYGTYFDMLNSAYESINFAENKEFDLIEKKGKEKLKGQKLEFKSLISNEEVFDEKTISKSVNKIITKEEKENLEYGTKLHSIFENADLSKDNDNKYVSNFLKTDLFKNDIINTYREYEFFFNDKIGKIDLILETNDEMIIVDYKTNDIEKEEYIEQVNTYYQFLISKTNKKVSGYLYSLVQNKLKKVI